MLGIESTEIALAYVLCIAASLLCIGFGILTWNQKSKDPVRYKRVIEKPASQSAPPADSDTEA